MGNYLVVDEYVDVWRQLEVQLEMHNDPSKILAKRYMRKPDASAPVLPVATCVGQAQSWMMPMRIGDPKQHRDKLLAHYTFVSVAMVARPVGRA